MITRIFTDAPEYEPPVRYKIRTPETWEKARADYCAGMPAPAVCARYDIGLSALRQRARAEGWRRVDCGDPEPEPIDVDAHQVMPGDLAKHAWARTARAVEQGRVLEALRWSRLAAGFRQAAAEVNELARIRRLLGEAEAEAETPAPEDAAEA